MWTLPNIFLCWKPSGPAQWKCWAVLPPAPRAHPKVLSWRAWRVFHSWPGEIFPQMWTKSEASQRPEPSPWVEACSMTSCSKPGSVLGDVLPGASRVYGHSIYHCIQGKKIYNKKSQQKKNKTKIFMSLGGANLEISLAQIELLSRQ